MYPETKALKTVACHAAKDCCIEFLLKINVTAINCKKRKNRNNPFLLNNLIKKPILTVVSNNYLIRKLNLSIFLSAIPVPRTTALNGSSATKTGKPVFL